MNLSETVLDRFAEDMPDHPALVYEDRTISYGDLLRSVNRLANALTKLGVGKGDRVLTLMGNRPEFVHTYFACLRIGAVVVTVNPLSTAYELSHYMVDCKPKAVACTSDQVSKIDSLRDRADYLKIIISTETASNAITFSDIEKDFSDTFVCPGSSSGPSSGGDLHCRASRSCAWGHP